MLVLSIVSLLLTLIPMGHIGIQSLALHQNSWRYHNYLQDFDEAVAKEEEAAAKKALEQSTTPASDGSTGPANSNSGSSADYDHYDDYLHHYNTSPYLKEQAERILRGNDGIDPFVTGLMMRIMLCFLAVEVVVNVGMCAVASRVNCGRERKVDVPDTIVYNPQCRPMEAVAVARNGDVIGMTGNLQDEQRELTAGNF